MRMQVKTVSGRGNVVIQNAKHAESHFVRVPVVGEAKTMSRFQPVVVAEPAG